ncbi:CHRD domain-containing protein [Pseudanabaena sp. UWO310]|uniref:CHRD domain-containing protein n=1 Tax=Pseudanabaena sp. UWO310 TaxID=2480795 RepID=UPI001156D84D|nr:CHRD domain-containing protein [Pseudanabaena sp. UWO310]TYQ29784.1 CHRD domain-containing protein [Pseudanabaena sp. UWO310]
MIQFLRKPQKFLSSLVLSICVCLFAINISAPAHSVNLAAVNPQLIDTAINYQHQAEAELIAEQTSIGQSYTFTRFAAILTGDEIYPNAVSTAAAGVVGAALNGDRLIVRGGFYDLSSPLRDYATDPLVPPNPNITSGVHIHKGAPTANGAFQYALQVTVNPNGLSGGLKGEYKLTSEQLQALNSGGLYVDLHTKANRAGELRGILKLQS